MKKIIFFISLLGFFTALQAQSIRRATIGSVGSSVTVGDFRISSSFGQKSVACSVVQNFDEGLIVRQGFQQPTPDSPCPFSVAAAWEEIETECGFYYAFEYQGDADTDDALFTWDFGTAAYPEISNEVNPFQVGFAAEGLRTIRLTVEQEGCSNTFSFTLDARAATFGVNPLVLNPDCFGAPEGEITLEFFGGQEPYTITWDDGSTADRRTGLLPGNYSYKVVSSDGCEVTGIATVLNPADGLQLSGEMIQDNCDTDSPDGSINLIAINATGAAEFLWSNGETTEDIANLAAGTYTVTVLDAGCEAQMLFILENCGELNITDVMTPNNDGRNDAWIIPGIEDYPNNEVEIYNRWGNMVFNQRGYANDWLGTNNKGQNLVTGGYYYIVRLNDESDTVLGGSVTIVR